MRGVVWRLLLPVEDAGLLEGVLALGDVPHPDRPVAAAGGQQAFLAAPTTCDDLGDTETDVSTGRNGGGGGGTDAVPVLPQLTLPW